VTRRRRTVAFVAVVAGSLIGSELTVTPLTGPLTRALGALRDVPPTVERVDLEESQGTWYAVATQRTSGYQAACLDRTRATSHPAP